MKEKLEIIELLKQFYEISGFRASIHDTEFHEIYAYPTTLSPFCRLLQHDTAVKQACYSSDIEAFRRAEKTGEAFVYRCKHGLYEAVAPIYHYGVLSGYFMIGQGVPDSPAAQCALARELSQVIQNPEKSKNFVASLPSVSPQKAEAYLKIMTVLAEYITHTGSLSVEEGDLPRQVRQYIGKNYSQKITLDLLTQRFRCCRSTLTKGFHQAYGHSIMAEVTHVRMCAAVRLLKDSPLSVKEISNRCGFSDQNYFSRVFSDTYGCSPTEYRQKSD